MKIPLGRTTGDTPKELEMIGRINDLQRDVDELKRKVSKLEEQVYCDGNLPHGMPMPAMRTTRRKDPNTRATSPIFRCASLRDDCEYRQMDGACMYEGRIPCRYGGWKF